MSDQILIVMTTVETREQASRLAHQLVEQQLAACVQIEGPLRSVYRWHEKTETAPEWKLSVKTVDRLYPELEQALQEQHPYEVPQILACTVTAVSQSYEKWLREQLRANS